MNRLQKLGSDLYHHPFTVTRSVDEAEIAIHKIHRSMKDIALVADVDKIVGLKSQIDTHEEEALQHLQTAGEQFLGDSQLVENVVQSLIDWRPIREEVIRLRLAGDLRTADTIVRDKGVGEVTRLEQELGELKLFANRIASESVTEADEIMRQSSLLIGYVYAVAVLLSIAIAVLITHSIRVPLRRLDRAATEVSQGDLGHQIEIVSQDELGRLSSTFNFMVTNIRELTEEIQRKNEENERLLLNILPAPIADRLKGGEEPIADYFPEITVLFADIVGFTSMSESITPDELVELLNRLFSEFDDSAKDLGIEKIKTIGDCYMAVAGLVNEIDDPPAAMVKMASEMLRSVESLNLQLGISLEIRIGINCGPVIAGVIGKSKFIYDLWGDTVNVASRMESHGLAGRIHVSEAVYERVKGKFELEGRGLINIKGKGEIETYLIIAEDQPE
jgi:class 3 adenylate cyclase